MSALPFNTLVGLLVCLLLIIILLLICLFCRKRALKCLSASCACCCGAFIHLFSCCMVQFTSAIIWMAESIRQKCAGRAAGDNQSQNEPGSEVIPKENLFLNCFTRFFLHWDLTIFICFFQFILLFLSFFVSPVNFFVAIALLFFLGSLFLKNFIIQKPKKDKGVGKSGRATEANLIDMGPMPSTSGMSHPQGSQAASMKTQPANSGQEKFAMIYI